MKILSTNDCLMVSGANAEKTQVISNSLTTNASSKRHNRPRNGLYFMRDHVEDLEGNVLFSGTSGSFEHNGITYNIKQVSYTQYNYTN